MIYRDNTFWDLRKKTVALIIDPTFYGHPNLDLLQSVKSLGSRWATEVGCAEVSIEISRKNRASPTKIGILPSKSNEDFYQETHWDDLRTQVSS